MALSARVKARIHHNRWTREMRREYGTRNWLKYPLVGEVFFPTVVISPESAYGSTASLNEGKQNGN